MVQRLANWKFNPGHFKYVTSSFGEWLRVTGQYILGVQVGGGGEEGQDNAKNISVLVRSMHTTAVLYFLSKKTNKLSTSFKKFSYYFFHWMVVHVRMVNNLLFIL